MVKSGLLRPKRVFHRCNPSGTCATCFVLAGAQRPFAVHPILTLLEFGKICEPCPRTFGLQSCGENATVHLHVLGRLLLQMPFSRSFYSVLEHSQNLAPLWGRGYKPEVMDQGFCGYLEESQPPKVHPPRGVHVSKFPEHRKMPGTPTPNTRQKYEQTSDDYGQYCWKTRENRQFAAMFLFMFLPCMWGLGFRNDSP